MIAIVDYGVGNIYSLQSSLAFLGADTVVSGDAEVLKAADKVILPGVGAFGDAMDKLREAHLAGPLVELAGQGKTLLGICLGMQLLFERSTEFGSHKGLGLIPGEIAPLQADLDAGAYKLKVPHMGWNRLEIIKQDSPLLKNTHEGDYFYYVHSFYAKACQPSLVAGSEYGVFVPGVVQNGRVYGTQFHPEKSGEAGLALLKAFLEVA